MDLFLLHVLWHNMGFIECISAIIYRMWSERVHHMSDFCSSANINHCWVICDELNYRGTTYFFISLRELQYHVTCQINEACSLSLLAPKHGSTHHYNACALTAPFRAYYTCSLLTFAHWTSKLLPSHKIGATCFCLAGDIWVGQLFSQSPDTLVMRFRWKVGVRSPENLILFLQTCCSKSVKGYLWLWMGQN